MTDQVSETESLASPESTTYIGEELRAARLARSMEISEIARRLNLEEHVVEGLEQANYEGLPEMAYIRGYLIAYVRLMDLPESLMKRFNEEHPLHVDLVSPSAPKRSACSRDGWVKCITWALILVLLVITGIWGLEQYTQYTENRSVSVAQPVQSVERSDTAIVNNTEEQPMPQPEPFVVGDDAGENMTNESEEAAAEPAMEDVDTPSSADTMNTEAPVSNEVEPVDPEQAVNDTEQVTEYQPPAEELEPVASVPELVINFLDTSWVSISDSNGNSLRGGTFNKGQTVTLEHQGELRMIIGRAKNVELTYDGNPVDLSGYASVARLSLGKPAE